MLNQENYFYGSQCKHLTVLHKPSFEMLFPVCVDLYDHDIVKVPWIGADFVTKVELV